MAVEWPDTSSAAQNLQLRRYTAITRRKHRVTSSEEVGMKPRGPLLGSPRQSLTNRNTEIKRSESIQVGRSLPSPAVDAYDKAVERKAVEDWAANDFKLLLMTRPCHGEGILLTSIRPALATWSSGLSD